MFNSFAIGRPLCRWIKVNLTGLGVRLVALCVRAGCRTDGVPELGDDATDGVDQPISFPHDVEHFPGRVGQPDRRDLGHAGAARHRPHDQPGSDHPGLRRHHRPDHSAAHPGDRADRAADRGRARAQQAVDRFRNHRDERGRHVAVVPVPRLHGGGDRGVAVRDGDQRLFRAQGPAHAARLAHRGARQCGEHHRAAGPFHLRSRTASPSISANATAAAS